MRGMNSKKKVLVIDDSALVREILTDIINSLDNFTVVGTAPDPLVGADKVMRLNPDIITLDIEMPKMDGLTFLEKLMRIHPRPVLIISSLAQHNSDLALKALELGALDYICKPARRLTEVLPELKREVYQKLELCCIGKINVPKESRMQIEKRYRPNEVKVKNNNLGEISKQITFSTTDKIIVIGASTGGTVALARLLQACPTNLPGIVIVQHMPPGFTKSFANRLNCDTQLVVKEAEDNDTIIPGQVLIAPGGKHLLVDRSGSRFFVRTSDHPPVKHHRPSVDVLFRSAALTVGQNAVGIIMTGMGDDGAEGMLELKQSGAYNIAQDENSCIVFGMPKVAIEKGAVDTILPLDQIAGHLLKYRI